MNRQMENILIVFSNPSDTSRLRLDRENKALEALAERFASASINLDRRNAATREDLAQALAAKPYRIVHFSGHGSEEAFYVDTEAGASDRLSPSELRDLLRQFQPKLALLALMSCYSDSAVANLVDCAAYVISVQQEANDEAAIKFSRNLYEGYIRTKSIEQAFGIANFVTESQLTAVLSRRAAVGGQARELVAVYSRRRVEPMYMDLSEAEESIRKLGIPRDTVVSTLGRKMHIHRWIFEEPRDRAILTVGPFFGVFSWRSASDIIICHRILKIRAEADPDLIDVWARLIVTYNDLYMSEYRLLEKAVNRGSAHTVATALAAFKQANEMFFSHLETAKWLEGEERALFASIAATFSANVAKAEEKLQKEEYGRAVIFLETALSSVHDFIDSLAGSLAEN